MRAFPRWSEILLTTKAGNEIWSSFNPHTMYNVIKESKEFQKLFRNYKKINDSVTRFSKNHERKLDVLIKCRQ